MRLLRFLPVCFAFSLLTTVATADTSSVEAARQALKAGDYSSAIALATQGWTALGGAYFGLQDASDAINSYNRAIELDPNDEEAIEQRGKNFENLRLYDQTLADYARVLQLDPRNAETYNNRATLYTGMGRLDDAITDFTKSIELDPTDFATFLNRAYCYYFQKKYDLAAADLAQAKKLHDDPQIEKAFEATESPAAVKRWEFYMADLEQKLDNAPK